MGMFEIIKRLFEAGVDFVVVGGLAVALQGYQRLTMDVDVVLAMNQENLARFVECAKLAGLRPTISEPLKTLAQPDLIEYWYQEKGMLAFSLRSPDMLSTVVDVLVKAVVPYVALRRDASMINIGTLRVPIASIDHLIEMKTGTGRNKDVIDIEELKKIRDGVSE